MTHKADAWMLYAGDTPNASRAELVRETIEISAPGDDEVIAEPIYGCWEGNMNHALDRHPIDICKLRREEKVVIGNSGVVRVVECGKNVKHVEPGQAAVILCGGQMDRWGYPETVLGYDARGMMGCLSTVMKLDGIQLLAVPDGSKHSLAQWAAFPIRYFTAWSNWLLAYGVFRLSVSEEECPDPHVWAWGGGVSLAELDLAKRAGCRTVMISGSDRNLASIRRTGITALDRRDFGVIAFDRERFEADADYRREYKRSEVKFLKEVRRRTDGEMVQIFLDYIGSPLYRLTLRALSREGVITTAGWKEGMEMRHQRATECIDRHQHIHTHGAKLQQAIDAMAFGEANDWVPEVDERIYSFDEVPELASDFHAGRTGYFPCFSVNPE